MDYSKLFNCNKKKDGDDDGTGKNTDTEPSMDPISGKNLGGGDPTEKSGENSI